MAEDKKAKSVKVKLKLRRPHPRKVMYLGKHKVGIKFEEFELNEAEQKELKSKGGVSWFITDDDHKKELAAKKEVAKKKEKEK